MSIRTGDCKFDNKKKLLLNKIGEIKDDKTIDIIMFFINGCLNKNKKK